MEADISVIVPIYNSEKSLPQCIESIIHQAFSALEIILVDDGSTDSSGSIADQYARRDSRIKVIHKENGGLVSARKAGIIEAEGKYIAYVDSDDYIDADWFEKMYKKAQAYNADVVVCGFVRDNLKGEKRKEVNAIESGVYKDDNLLPFYQRMINFGEYYTSGIFPSVWSKLFRKELILERQLSVPEEITMGEDSACTFPTLLKANCIVVDNDIIGYHYCEIEGSMTKAFNRNYFTNLSVLYDYLKGIYQHHLDYNLQKQLELYRLYMLYHGVDQVRCDKSMTSIEKRQYLCSMVRQTSIFQNLDKTDMAGFPKKESKRLLLVYKGKWLWFKASYLIEIMNVLVNDLYQRSIKKGKEV